MEHLLTFLYILQSILCVLTLHCTVSPSKFHLDGDYLIGGLFDIHQVSVHIYYERPEAIDCSSEQFILASYQKLQLMRFSVEEINNSTNLLPNVSLGYEIFDHCSEKQNFPGILKLLSVNGSIRAWDETHTNSTKITAVVGPFSSTDTMTVTPVIMIDLIPVLSYGATSTALSVKRKYPSFLRTVHTNKDMIEVIVNIILHFNWRWVAFLNTDSYYGIDGLDMFRKRIKDTEICLAYSSGLTDDTNYSEIFKKIEAQRIRVIVAFASKKHAEALIDSAMQLNITNKVWIAGDTWSFNKRLSKEKGIKNIGTVLGVSEAVVKIPGFNDFIYSSKSQTLCGNAGQEKFCNQDCNCSDLNPDDIIAEDPSFSFAIYSAVYAIANALHNILQCGAGKCNGNITVQPHMVLEELKKSNFTLLNQSIQFDNNGDPKFGSCSVVFWNHSGVIEEVGFYKFNPSPHFFINSTQIHWHKHGEVPVSQCSPECDVGYQKKPDGNQKCCFHCEICPDGTYINKTDDPYECITCKETEWSKEGSTSCSLRVVEYIPFTDIEAILLMIGACVFVSLTLATSVLFAINYNTPIVKSAGGPMCFLILGCLTLCALSVFFYFDQPTVSFCILRFSLFLLFFTVCLACFVVHSFEIVFIFKIAAKFPKLHSWWKNYHGHWVVITGAFVIQALLLLFGFSFEPPRPYSETLAYRDKIILGCDYNLKSSSGPVMLLVSLCSLSFIFSYMGKDLPKNYNEAKSITFCFLLLILTWIIFATEYMLYRGKDIITHNALAILSSLYSFLFWYFLPKCYIIIFQPYKNTQQYFQGLIQNYTKTISQ